MNKTALISAVAEKTGYTKKQTGEILESLLSTITDELIAGDRVQILGFGTFDVKHISARQVINPRTRENISVPATTVPVFRAGNAFKSKLKASE